MYTHLGAQGKTEWKVGWALEGGFGNRCTSMYIHAHTYTRMTHTTTSARAHTHTETDIHMHARTDGRAHTHHLHAGNRAEEELHDIEQKRVHHGAVQFHRMDRNQEESPGKCDGTYACMHACKYACMYMCIHSNTNTYMCERERAQTHEYMHACMHACMDIRMHVFLFE